MHSTTKPLTRLVSQYLPSATPSRARARSPGLVPSKARASRIVSAACGLVVELQVGQHGPHGGLVDQAAPEGLAVDRMMGRLGERPAHDAERRGHGVEARPMDHGR